MKTYKCQNASCETKGRIIPIDRVYSALSRGHREPKYCSDTCQNTATVRNKRARKALVAKTPAKRRKSAAA